MKITHKFDHAIHDAARACGISEPRLNEIYGFMSSMFDELKGSDGYADSLLIQKSVEFAETPEEAAYIAYRFMEIVSKAQ
jgi:hypothetical protein